MFQDMHSACPGLPQYGTLRAACPARLPSKQSWLVAVATIFSFLLSYAMVKVALEKNMNWPERDALLWGLGAGLVIATIVCFATKRAKFSQQSLFVFDGGIHLNENVSYIVSYGQLISFCKGVREVSIPWRKISDFSAKEITRKGQTVVEASIKIPDGRTLVFATDLGGESGNAITTLIEKLGRPTA